MTCTSSRSQFRLLDGYVGWDEASVSAYLTGLTDTIGLRIQGIETPHIDAENLAQFIPPVWLARGCAMCEWYLLGSDAQSDGRPRILSYSPCHQIWKEITSRLSGADRLRQPSAIAFRGHRLAVADSQLHQVLIWDVRNGRRLADIDISNPGPMAFSGWCEFIVVQPPESKRERIGRLVRFDFAGSLRGNYEIPVSGPIDRLATGNDGALWVAAETGTGDRPFFELTRVALIEIEPINNPATEAEPEQDESARPHVIDAISCCRQVELSHAASTPVALRTAFSPLGLIVAQDGGFCFDVPGSDGTPRRICFHRHGDMKAEAELVAIRGTVSTATLQTGPLDSGIPRCRWHRVRVNSQIQAGSSVSIRVATSEDGAKPHSQDWQLAELNATDFLIQQPPGRYLYVEVVLEGDADTTPIVQRIRLDFPRQTSLDQLPAIYRENREAEDFTERFLSLFDSSTEEVDRSIERFAALLDPAGVPGDALPWLGGFLGMAFHSSWNDEERRRLLQAAPQLYRKRGTPAGLVEAIELIFGVTPAIQERPQQRVWGVLNSDARLRDTRLFGKNTARFRLGRSALGAAPVRGSGDPDQDPFAFEAYRFTLLMPPSSELDDAGRQQLEQLVISQSPAHTVHNVRFGGSGLIVGRWSSVGVDTAMQSPEPPVLGSRRDSQAMGNVRLNRSSILQAGRRGCSRFRVGDSAVGIQTVLE